MQALEIVPRLLPEVRAGKKLHTIRWGEREIVPGPMAYVNALDASDTVVVWVTHVEKMLLSDVALRLGKSEEWPDVELLEGMREHYPRIEMGSEVVVIHHLSPDA
ncbi:ASCH domain-containing protein [Enterobacter hormaechei]